MCPPAGDDSRRQAVVEQCRRLWRPGCDRYGVAPAGTPPPVPPPVPPDVQKAAELLGGGPQVPTFANREVPAFTGFIRQGWPGVIDFQAPAGAEARVNIDLLNGGGHASVMLPRTKDGRRIVYRFQLDVPDAGGREVGVARYVVRARVLPDDAPRWVDVPVQVFGFGAGPRAVGSVAINDMRYAPTALQRPTGSAHATLAFDYRLENGFDLVAEDLWRDCKGIGPFCNFSHPHRPFRALDGGPHRWAWDIDRKAKLGQYQLVVRAWQSCGAPADPSVYKQCGDEAAWVVASAGPVFIQP
jgi:hypothetical protein